MNSFPTFGRSKNPIKVREPRPQAVGLWSSTNAIAGQRQKCAKEVDPSWTKLLETFASGGHKDSRSWPAFKLKLTSCRGILTCHTRHTLVHTRCVLIIPKPGEVKVKGRKERKGSQAGKTAKEKRKSQKKTCQQVLAKRKSCQAKAAKGKCQANI